MSDVLQVNKKNAIKAFNSADKAGKKLLSDLFEIDFSGKLIDRLMSMDDVFEEGGVIAAHYQLSSSMPHAAMADMYEKRLDLIERVFNEGWVANMADTSQNKYCPYFNIIKDKDAPGGFRLSFFVSGFGNVYSSFGVRHYFKDKATSDAVGKLFLAEFEGWAQYLNLLRQPI